MAMSHEKPILMIHEFRVEMLKLPLQNYILTFDDGLYTQFLLIEDLIKIPTQKIFFISTGIVADTQTNQSNEFITCRDAHDRFKVDGDLSNYMNWEQLLYINQQPSCELGGHSHMHKLNNSNIVKDTKQMMMVWKKMKVDVNKFCFPYNDQNTVYIKLLQMNGFKQFFGSGRIDINELL